MDPFNDILQVFTQPGHWTVKAITLIGLLRTFFKPACALVEKFIQSQGSNTDIIRLQKVESSLWFKAIAFLLDYSTSIKLSSLKPAEVPPGTILLSAKLPPPPAVNPPQEPPAPTTKP